MDVVWHWIVDHGVALAVIGGVLPAVLIGIVAINRDIRTPGKGTAGGSASAGGMFGGFEEIFAPNAHSAHQEQERQRRTPATRTNAHGEDEKERPIVITTLPNGRLRATIRKPDESDPDSRPAPHRKGPADGGTA